MTSEAELGWLAGIIDGEGCIRAYWSNRKQEVGGSLAIDVRVEACSFAMIGKVASLLTGLGVHYHFEKHRLPKAGNRVTQRITIKRKLAVLALLDIISPYLVVKQREADVAREFYRRWPDQRRLNTARAPKEEKIFVFQEIKRLKMVA